MSMIRKLKRNIRERETGSRSTTGERRTRTRSAATRRQRVVARGTRRRKG
jgi:hypothetical protein